MDKFEKNGGYYIDGVRYMDCKITGVPVRNVGEDATYVISDRALMSKMYKMFPDTYENKSTQRVSTGRPAGWHFMAEFVDKDGKVYHKGVEQPKLKGKLKPTVIEEKVVVKLTKGQKAEQQQTILKEIGMLKKQHKKETRKTYAAKLTSQIIKLQRDLKKVK